MTKIYLLWDLSELRGIFSTLEKAKKAARQQIAFRKKEQAKDTLHGKVGKDFEHQEPEWKYWNVGYEIIYPDTVRYKRVEIREMVLDRSGSLLKKIYRRKDEAE